MRLFRNISLVVLAFLSLVTVTTIVRAQTNADTASENIKKAVEYPLPYPGILPDNTLYSLKVLRDKAIEFLTVDPLKKAEFYLLQADKRLASAESLVSKGKYQLAEQTTSKAEKYFLLAINQLILAKSKGKDIVGVSDRMRRAASKHSEIILLLISKSPAEFKLGLTQSGEIVKGIESSLMTPVATNSGQTSF